MSSASLSAVYLDNASTSSELNKTQDDPEGEDDVEDDAELVEELGDIHAVVGAAEEAVEDVQALLPETLSPHSQVSEDGKLPFVWDPSAILQHILPSLQSASPSLDIDQWRSALADRVDSEASVQQALLTVLQYPAISTIIRDRKLPALVEMRVDRD